MAFSTVDDIRTWLESFGGEAAVPQARSLAVRTALRIFPFVVFADDIVLDDRQQRLFLSACRALVVARAGLDGGLVASAPHFHQCLEAVSAAIGIDDRTTGLKAVAIPLQTRSAMDAAGAAGLAVSMMGDVGPDKASIRALQVIEIAMASVARLKGASGTYGAFVLGAAEADARVVEAGGTTLDAPLWSAAPPPQWSGALDRLITLLTHADGAWSIWRDWYVAIAHGDPPWMPSSDVSRGVENEIARRSDDAFWGRKAAAIHANVMKLISDAREAMAKGAG